MGMTFAKTLQNKQIAKGGVPPPHSATTLGSTPPKCSSTKHFVPWGTYPSQSPIFVQLNTKKRPTMPQGLFVSSNKYQNVSKIIQLINNNSYHARRGFFVKQNSSKC